VGERPASDPAEGGADRRPRAIRGRERALQHPAQHLGRVLALEWQHSDGTLVEQHAEAEDVGALGDRPSLDLLRGHVRRRAENLPGRGDPLGVEELGDAEVRQLDPGAPRRWVLGVALDARSVEIEQDVLRLDVPMDDAVFVSVGQRLAHLDGDAGGDLGGQVAVLREQPAQGGPLDELDDEVSLRLRLVGDVVHVHDPRVPELGDRPRLPGEPGRDLGVLPEMPVDDLDGHFPVEPPVVRPVHGRHTAVAELLEQVVLREVGLLRDRDVGERATFAQSWSS
jgi:hypothetical protein